MKLLNFDCEVREGRLADSFAAICTLTDNQPVTWLTGWKMKGRWVPRYFRALAPLDFDAGVVDFDFFPRIVNRAATFAAPACVSMLPRRAT